MRRRINTFAAVRAHLTEIEARLDAGFTVHGACEWLSQLLAIDPPIKFYTFRNALQKARRDRPFAGRPSPMTQATPEISTPPSEGGRSKYRKRSPLGEILDMKNKGEI